MWSHQIHMTRYEGILCKVAESYSFINNIHVQHSPGPEGQGGPSSPYIKIISVTLTMPPPLGQLGQWRLVKMPLELEMGLIPNLILGLPEQDDLYTVAEIIMHADAALIHNGD